MGYPIRTRYILIRIFLNLFTIYPQADVISQLATNGHWQFKTFRAMAADAYFLRNPRKTRPTFLGLQFTPGQTSDKVGTILNVCDYNRIPFVRLSFCLSACLSVCNKISKKIVNLSRWNFLENTLGREAITRGALKWLNFKHSTNLGLAPRCDQFCIPTIWLIATKFGVVNYQSRAGEVFCAFGRPWCAPVITVLVVCALLECSSS